MSVELLNQSADVHFGRYFAIGIGIIIVIEYM
jgi:hypothetical protein